MFSQDHAEQVIDSRGIIRGFELSTHWLNPRQRLGQVGAQVFYIFHPH